MIQGRAAAEAGTLTATRISPQRLFLLVLFVSHIITAALTRREPLNQGVGDSEAASSPAWGGRASAAARPPSRADAAVPAVRFLHPLDCLSLHCGTAHPPPTQAKPAAVKRPHPGRSAPPVATRAATPTRTDEQRRGKLKRQPRACRARAQEPLARETLRARPPLLYNYHAIIVNK
jgi:hypothetical protein